MTGLPGNYRNEKNLVSTVLAGAFLLRVLLWLLLFSLPLPLLADSVIVDSNFTRTRIVRLQTLVTSATLTPEEVLSQKLHVAHESQIKLSPVESVWFRLEVRAYMKEATALVIRYEVPWTDRAEFFVYDAAGKLTEHSLAGDTVPGNRLVRLPMIRTQVAANASRIILLHVTNKSQTPAEIFLYNEGAHNTQVFIELSTQGLFIGIVILLLLFQGNLYWATRDPVMLRYLFYLTAIGIFIPVRTGLIPQKLMGQYAHHSDAVWVFLVSLAYFAGMSFARAFLDLKNNWLRMDRIAQILQYLCLTPVLMLLVSKYSATVVENLIGLVVGPPLLILGLLQYYRNRGNALYFVTAYSVPIFAVIVDNLVEVGALPVFPGRRELLPAAIAIEFLLFALVIYRKFSVNTLEKARNQAKLARLENELAFARIIQQQLLPAMHHNFSGAQIDAIYRPQKEVGGNYFDIVQPFPNTIGIIISEVDNQGLAAALDASAVRMAFRSHFTNETRVDAVVQDMSLILRSCLHSSFCSVTYVLLDLTKHEGTICSAGSPPVILGRKNGSAEKISSGNAALGEKNVDEPFRLERFSFDAGDYLLLHTRGMTANLATAQNFPNSAFSADADGNLLLEEILGLTSGQKNPKPRDNTIILVRFSVLRILK